MLPQYLAPGEARSVVPIHYDLVLEPDLQNAIFGGTVKILVEVVEKTSLISVNVCDLHIINTAVQSLSRSSPVSFNTTVSYHAKEQTACISLVPPLEAGARVQVIQSFKGTLNDQMMGFYLSRYTDGNNQSKVLATSQLEPNEARRVFPCFDEPALKATFSVTLVVSKDLTCLSNMDVAEEFPVEMATDKMLVEDHRWKKVVKFNRTPKMSTYLLAFIVGELQYVESDMFHVPVRVYMPRRKDANLEHASYSLDLAVRTLRFYEEKFDVKYPLPKLDMIAVPDFPAGAMENWGLITFREADLLFEEGNGSISNKLRTTLTVQHEIAHQWFGNLVTMDSWNGLWLKEGFATWMSWYACDIFYPDWKVWGKFVAGSLQDALCLDSLPSSHPLELPVQEKSTIGYAFDAISYLKGCSLVRMLFSYLGEEGFMTGIQRYLNCHAYGNASTVDLWRAMGHSTESNFVDVMSLWTTQVGHPIVSVTVTEDSISLEQDRYLQCEGSPSDSKSENYPVPLNIRSVHGVLQGMIFTEKNLEIKVDGFLKINADQTGIYRTLYDSAHLQRLAMLCTENDKLSVEDRIGIISDTGALAASGHMKTSAFLKLLMSFGRESQPVVWEVIFRHLHMVRSAWLFEDPSIFTGFEALVRSLVEKKLSKMDWKFDRACEVEKHLRALFIGAAGQAGDRGVIAMAKRTFSDWVETATKIDPNLRPDIFRVVLQHGGPVEYSKVLNEYMTATTSTKRNTALQCLGYAPDLALVEQTLELALSGHVRDQDLHLVLGSLQTHRTGIEASWLWLQQNWVTFSRHFSNRVALGKLVKTCTAGLATPQHRESVETFFSTQGKHGIETLLAQVLESINIKSSWVARDRYDVASFVEAQLP